MRICDDDDGGTLGISQIYNYRTVALGVSWDSLLFIWEVHGIAPKQRRRSEHLMRSLLQCTRTAEYLPLRYCHYRHSIIADIGRGAEALLFCCRRVASCHDAPPDRSIMACRKAFFAFLALLLAASIYPTTGKAVRSMNPSQPGEWHPKVAEEEVHDDISAILKLYDDSRDDLEHILEKYKRTLIKDGKIRLLAVWGVALSQLMDMHSGAHDKDIYLRLMDVSELMLKSFTSMHSYVEDTVMRGWPMYVNKDDPHPVFEAYNFGFIGEAIASAARHAAGEYGEHAQAARMLKPVLQALYDGFYTHDIEMTKVDSKGRVVYVPEGASKDRKKRQMKVTPDEPCIEAPQAYNHGLMIARASMAAYGALEAIDWDQASWGMDAEWTKAECKDQMAKLIRQNARWLRKGLATPEPTGSDRRDKYPGSKGTEWYQWNYRDLSDCKELQGGYLDRPEDVAHATYEVKFITQYRHWEQQHGSGDDDSMFDKDDIRKLMVTFLNRIVYDYDAPGSERFACDVEGINDNSDWGHPWKQCGNTRRLAYRAKIVPGWLALAHVVKDDIGKDDKLLRCDALRVVRTILPLVVKGKEFDAKNFKPMLPKWAPDAISAKYYYYNYESEFKDHCD